MVPVSMYMYMYMYIRKIHKYMLFEYETDTVHLTIVEIKSEGRMPLHMTKEPTCTCSTSEGTSSF